MSSAIPTPPGHRPASDALPPELDRIACAAATAGLVLRGAFHPAADDAVPACHDGSPTRTLVLLGNVGSSLWPAFAASPEYRDGAPHPLDRWSRRVIDGLAADCSAMPLYPFGGPPHHPFVAWARRAEPVQESPLGLLIHPDHGLWHAYRGALALPRTLALPPPDTRPRPCDICSEQPCLRACPVGAFTGSVYDVAACTGFLATDTTARCARGCGARHACPVGREHAYAPAHAIFLMDAFRKAHGTS